MGAKRSLSSRNPLSPKVAARIIRQSSSLLDLLAGIARIRGWRGAASILSSKRVKKEKNSNLYILLGNPLFEVGASNDILKFFTKICFDDVYQAYYFPSTKKCLEALLVN